MPEEERKDERVTEFCRNISYSMTLCWKYLGCGHKSLCVYIKTTFNVLLVWEDIFNTMYMQLFENLTSKVVSLSLSGWWSAVLSGAGRSVSGGRREGGSVLCGV